MALETNPTLVDLLRGAYAPYSGNLYHREDVRVEIGDGRSFLRGKPAPFDLIVFPLTETLGASASGLSSLREDYRLTVEAFQDYLEALNPDGFLSVQLYLLPPPRSELRLVSLLKEACERSGRRRKTIFWPSAPGGPFPFSSKRGKFSRGRSRP